jgi:hypothetical protein
MKALEANPQKLPPRPPDPVDHPRPERTLPRRWI